MFIKGRRSVCRREEEEQLEPCVDCEWRDEETYLGEAADEPILSTGAVLAVLAVVEGARVAHGHAVQADVELRLDAAAQAVAAAGELSGGGEKSRD